MTHLSRFAPGQSPPTPPPPLHSLINETLGISVYGCKCQRESQTQRVVNRRTGRLVICSSAFSLTKHCLFVTTLCSRKFGFIWEFSCYIWEREWERECACAWACGGSHMFSAVLSKPVCSPGGCHGNSQTAADFAPASSGGLWEQRGGFNGEESLEEEKKERASGKNLQNFVFFWSFLLSEISNFQNLHLK